MLTACELEARLRWRPVIVESVVPIRLGHPIKPIFFLVAFGFVPARRAGVDRIAKNNHTRTTPLREPHRDVWWAAARRTADADDFAYASEVHTFCGQALHRTHGRPDARVELLDAEVIKEGILRLDHIKDWQGRWTRGPSSHNTRRGRWCGSRKNWRVWPELSRARSGPMKFSPTTHWQAPGSHASTRHART